MPAFSIYILRKLKTFNVLALIVHPEKALKYFQRNLLINYQLYT